MSKTLLRTVEWLGFLLLAAGLAAVWLAGREETLQWAARELSERTGGALVLEEVHGSLYRTISIGRARFEDTDLRIVGEGLEIDWEPWALLVRPHAARVNVLTVRRLEIASTSKTEGPPKPPDSLRLPLPVLLEDVSIGELLFTSGETRIEARRLHVAYQADGDSHRTRHRARRLRTYGILNGDLAVGVDAPFRVEGSLSFTAASRSIRIACALPLAGPSQS